MVVPGFEVRGIRQDERKFGKLPTAAHMLDGVDPNQPLTDQAPQTFKEQHWGQFFDAILDGKLPRWKRDVMKIQ